MEKAVVTAKGQVVIPSKLRRKFGIKERTRIFIYEKNGEIVVRPITDEYIQSMAGVTGTKREAAQSLKGREGSRAREYSRPSLFQLIWRSQRSWRS